ncbi:MAG TPA: hypothetical protein VMV94_19170 [Phycisphaerae bacterium]|nr:hypothetical protein [Phycisphaerae bacterium]
MRKLHILSILCVAVLSPPSGAVGSSPGLAAWLEQNVRSLPLDDDRISRTSVRDECPDNDNLGRNP